MTTSTASARSVGSPDLSALSHTLATGVFCFGSNSVADCDDQHDWLMPTSRLSPQSGPLQRSSSPLPLLPFRLTSAGMRISEGPFLLILMRSSSLRPFVPKSFASSPALLYSPDVIPVSLVRTSVLLLPWAVFHISISLGHLPVSTAPFVLTLVNMPWGSCLTGPLQLWLINSSYSFSYSFYL